jgi:hypothetical protein
VYLQIFHHLYPERLFGAKPLLHTVSDSQSIYLKPFAVKPSHMYSKNLG